MWVPRWLGEIYAKLYVRFGTGLFTFQDARHALSMDKSKLAVALSRLHSNRILLVFRSRRPKLYRLLDPTNFLFLASGAIANVDRIPQERYVKLLCDASRWIMRLIRPSSLAVYGSVARGSAEECSDLDLLVVSNAFTGSLCSRIDKLYEVERRVGVELAWLREHGVFTRLSLYPLREEEAERKPLLLLDLTEEAVILYDRNRFLETVLTGLRAKLLGMGARKVVMAEGKWYWDLKPDYRFGDVIEI